MKAINLLIKNCSECPYLDYDSYYSRSRDSGYDCKHDKGSRIIDDWEWSNTNNPKRLNLKMNTISIPDWCPLPNGKIYERKLKIKKLKELVK